METLKAQFAALLSSAPIAVLTANVLRFWGMSTETERKTGAVWYSEANAYACALASEFGSTLETAAHVISALSPGSPWERNLADALLTFRAVRQGFGPYEYVTCTYNANKIKAYRIARGEGTYLIGKGRKTLAFADNIIDPQGLQYSDPLEQPVTIDRHAIGILCNSVGNEHIGINLTAKRYRRAEQAYQAATALINATENTNYTPSQIQAITWLVYRSRFAYRRHSGNGQTVLAL